MIVSEGFIVICAVNVFIYYYVQAFSCRLGGSKGCMKVTFLHVTYFCAGNIAEDYRGRNEAVVDSIYSKHRTRNCYATSSL